MIRVLQVYPQLNNAGTEMVIMNLYNNIDREKVQFDFLVQKSGELDSVVKNMGARVFYIEKNPEYEKSILSFFMEHPEYKIIHTHTHKEMGIILKMAKKAGINNRIAHSHNYRGDVPKIIRLYKMLSSWDIEKYATHFLACSREAAMWLFPRKYNSCEVWKNAIALEKFQFDYNMRIKYRKDLNIPEDAKVVCHVGRFAEQKNHRKIINLLNLLVKKHDDFYGILVGVGPLLEEIKSKAESDRIVFLGNRTDVQNILCAGDLFLFPSNYEGLGIVAIEAQASGLKCIASENVPMAADIGTGLFEQISLKDDDAKWINTIENSILLNNINNRMEKSKEALETDYNIKRISANAQKFYLSL